MGGYKNASSKFRFTGLSIMQNKAHAEELKQDWKKFWSQNEITKWGFAHSSFIYRVHRKK